MTKICGMANAAVSVSCSLAEVLAEVARAPLAAGPASEACYQVLLALCSGR